MVFFDEQGGEHVEETKRFFVHLASYFSGEDFHSLRVGWENEFWTEEEQIQLVVQNQKYFFHPILLNPLRNLNFIKLEESASKRKKFTHENPFIFRNCVKNVQSWTQIPQGVKEFF